MIESTGLVSVVVPSFNHRAFIDKAIQSVLSQTYEAIELIVIDDGSTDGSVSYLEELSSQHGFIFVSQENVGVSNVLNRGIREISRGEYVCLLGSDDYLEPEKIQRQIRAMNDNPGFELCYTQAKEFDSDTGEVFRTFPKRNVCGYVLNQVIFHQPYAGGSMLFTRALYDKIGGFDESLAIEDWDFSIRAAAATKFLGIGEPLFNYRSHATNTMKLLDRRRIFSEKAKILSKNYMLVSPLRWLLCLCFHFIYDHTYLMLNSLFKK